MTRRHARNDRLTVADLRSLLEALPGDALVVVPAPDHSYRPIRGVASAMAEVDGEHLGEFWEDYGAVEDGSLTSVAVIE